MKSVCILLQNHYEPDIRVRRKAEALVAAGYAVDVLALRSNFAASKTYQLNGVTVYTISLGKKRGSLLRYLFEYVAFFVWCFFKLFSLHRKKRYAVVDVNNLPDFLLFAAAWAKWKGAKLVFDMHEITPEFYISKYGMKESSVMVKLLKLVERASFKFADHVITITEPIKELLGSRGLPASKCTVVMNSVDEALFQAPVTAVPEPAAAVAPGKFIMMYHGTLTRIYGLDIAIEAFSLVHKQMPGAQFWILGGGPERKALEELCRNLGVDNKVSFIGNVLPQEVRQWLHRSDVGVLATRRDVFLDFSFSNKLSEYIIMDKPVIASRLRTIHHYFTEQALAFFEPGKAQELAEQMLRLYADPALRGRFVEKAKQEYAPINWEVMKHRYFEMMSGLLGNEPGRTVQGAIPNTAVAEIQSR